MTTASERPDVFLSIGRTATPEQHAFVEAIEHLLTSNGLVPRTVGQTDFTHQKPLKRIREVIEACSGTLIVALERIHITEGKELRGSPDAIHIADVNLPTVWTQIEAAIAYTLGQPLLAIVESGLRNEGILEEGYDWYVKWVNLEPDSLYEPEFLQVFAKWKKSVVDYHTEKTA
jgi:hypothetical protein